MYYSYAVARSLFHRSCVTRFISARNSPISLAYLELGLVSVDDVGRSAHTHPNAMMTSHIGPAARSIRTVRQATDNLLAPKEKQIYKQ